MRVLIGCEFSGVVRRAFRARGHEAFSCDLIPAEDGSEHHHVGPIEGILSNRWDLGIFFPPCTRLTRAGARWWPGLEHEQDDAAMFFLRLYYSRIPRVALENPIGHMSSRFRKPDQIIQPWQFGHGETKATCLWLRGLPLLKPTNVVEGREPRVFWEAPGPDRWKRRSRTLEGIAEAMADQWGSVVHD